MKPPKLSLVLFVVCAAAIAGVWRLWSQTQAVREDELLHLHDAWLVSRGALPYRDFFEHHACWYHFLLAPVAALFAPALNFGRAEFFVGFARELSLLIALVGLALLVCLGRLWKSWALGLLAAALLTGVPFFLETAIETRPDVPAFALWMGALVWLWAGFREDARSGVEPSAEKRGGVFRCPFFWSGVCLGAAVMFTQKMLFALPGLGAALGVWGLLGVADLIEARPLRLLRWGVGLAAPMLLTWLFFVWHGAGFAFIDKVFLINARWAHRESPWSLFDWFFGESWLLLALGAAGAVWVLVRGGLERRVDWFAGVLVAVAGGWFVGLFWIIPVTDRQFYMIMLPPLALLAAYVLLDSLRYWHRYLRPLIWIGILVLAVAAPIETSWNRIVSWRNWQNPLEDALWVIDNTEPEATFLDGWTGAGVFRPQAWYYGFVHREIPPMISAAEREALMRDLESGAVRPELIAFDSNLLGLHPRLPDWVAEHYRLVPNRKLWRRDLPAESQQDAGEAAGFGQ